MKKEKEGTMQLKKEIAQQPSVLQRLLSDGQDATRRVAAAIRDFNPVFACIAARGTSDNAACYAQYLFGSRLRLPVMLATPSLHTVYKAPPDLAKALVIGISQSGKAEDVRAVVVDARKQGALTLAISNFDDSPLAQAAAHHLPLRAGREFSVAATKTYTAQLAVIAMLTTALADDADMQSHLKALPALARQTLGNSDDIEGWAQEYGDSDRLTVLGRGYNYATAREISLKVKELTYIASEGYSEADFRHGPIAVVQPGYPVMLVAPRGKSLAGMREMRATLDEKGADMLIISNDDELRRRGKHAMALPTIPEWLSPIVAVMPGQVFAMQGAIARGLNVDQPRGLSKVTITE